MFLPLNLPLPMAVVTTAPAPFSPGGIFPYIPLIVSSISALVGLIVAAFGLRSYQRARASTTWPFTEGKITESKVVPGSEGALLPKILYDYQVNGQPYQGDRLNAAHGNFGTTGTYAQTRVDRYRVGTRVQVFYNPAKPGQSALEPGVTVGAYITLGIGLLLVLSAVIEYFIMTRMMHFN